MINWQGRFVVVTAQVPRHHVSACSWRNHSPFLQYMSYLLDGIASVEPGNSDSIRGNRESPLFLQANLNGARSRRADHSGGKATKQHF